jgi:hypothetical protein
VPWRGSVLAPSAQVDLPENNTLEKVLKVLKHLRRQGTPMGAHRRPPDPPFALASAVGGAEATWVFSKGGCSGLGVQWMGAAFSSETVHDIT